MKNFANNLPGLSEPASSTYTPHAMRSGADWLACATQAEVDAFLDDLSENALLSLPWLFEFWALPHQLPPAGAWKTWVIMGGRGAGKTRAGSEWVRAEVEGAGPLDLGRSRRVALVGETVDQVIAVMIEGQSGILACTPPDRRPDWQATKKQLVWPNGAIAQVFSAHDPNSLRGPQFDAAWVDELAKWPKAEAAWDQLQFALRLGENPRQVVTTTPQNVGVLKDILRNPSTVMTHAPTEANRAYRPPDLPSRCRTPLCQAFWPRASRLGQRQPYGARTCRDWSALQQSRLRRFPAGLGAGRKQPCRTQTGCLREIAKSPLGTVADARHMLISLAAGDLTWPKPAQKSALLILSGAVCAKRRSICCGQNRCWVA
ncbi:hypothetical protein GCM10010873_35470 [Cypionkella aquatica]|uniref:Uncharacterized protein n=1 Tax=Cypionkella aquatica TaxID=1756042 RepID=A0AA37TVX5_9RHOB|nr:hypothetical protein GCM10010873_23610 [Cypionkella aquatica]GLS88573.1 hypothetical protein GCM10010873_35470 [Cypionkella aquatica]